MVLQPSISLTWILSRLCQCCPGSFICSAQSTFPLTVKSPGILYPFWQRQFKLGVCTVNISLVGQKQGYSDASFPSTVNNPPPYKPRPCPTTLPLFTLAVSSSDGSQLKYSCSLLSFYASMSFRRTSQIFKCSTWSSMTTSVGRIEINTKIPHWIVHCKDPYMLLPRPMPAILF